MFRGLLMGSIAAALGLPAVARAQTFPPITDRDFALDLYNGSALGSLQMVGMGGAAAAVVRGSAGMAINPASIGVRAATSVGTWDWDVHADWLNPGIGTDRDNNGIEDDQSEDIRLSPLVYLGGALQINEWAFGAALTTSTVTTVIDGSELDQNATQAQLQVAGSLWREQVVAGAGIRVGSFSVEDASEAELFSITATSLEAGGIWKPEKRDVRVGASVSFPASDTNTVVAPGCDPQDCNGLIVPERLEVPWSVVAGVAYRLADEPWNRKVAGKKWLDERYLLLAADVLVTGSVPEGHGIEAFSRNQLQVSGDRTVVSVRAGAEYEWVPGRFRIRGGSYYEPGRFRGADGRRVPGRVHATAGLDLRIWQFQVFRWKYRLRISLTADLAERYTNGGLSLGFWR